LLLQLLLLQTNVLHGSTIAVKSPNEQHLPVFVMHGFDGKLYHYTPLEQALKEHGFDRTYILDIDWGIHSIFASMETMLEHLSQTIDQYKARYNVTEYNLVCHSQGAVLCRTYLQSHPQHTAQAFVSLAGPHMGQFGLTGRVEHYLPLLRNITRQDVYEILYTHKVQSSFSVSNYWRDPFHYAQYQADVKFLPHFNNETVQANSAASQFRTNFVKLKRAVFLGSTADEIIEPPTSSLFEFWSTTSSVYEMVPMEKQEIYTSDLFGLKTMLKDGRAQVIQVPNVKHMEWTGDKTIVVLHVIPYLI